MYTGADKSKKYPNWHRRFLTIAWVLILATVEGCGGGGSSTNAGGTTNNAGTPAAATESVALEVPPALAQPPFDTAKTLVVPPGFGIRLLARVDGARFMALAPNGDILVSNPGAGRITLLRPQSGNVPEQIEFATGLQMPHDIVFHTIDGTTYLYVAEANRITRSIYTNGMTALGAVQVVVDNLPSDSTPELQGSYGHDLKNIALSADHKLYVSIASTCNACIEDAVSDPMRGAIYEYNADGSGRRLYARGLRNAEGLDFVPGTNDLWVTVNSRDNVEYPFDRDFDGDGSNDLGKVLQSYVDENPPDLFTRVRDGGNYGWPYCNPLPNDQMTNLELVADFEINPDGANFSCTLADRAAKGLPAHSAALGMSMLQNSKAPPAYRGGAVMALHGCWNCSRLDSGYKIVFLPFNGTEVGSGIDLVSGFVTDPDSRTVWGRPVDAISDGNGNILISDDYAGAIYQLYPS